MPGWNPKGWPRRRSPTLSRCRRGNPSSPPKLEGLPEVPGPTTPRPGSSTTPLVTIFKLFTGREPAGPTTPDGSVKLTGSDVRWAEGDTQPCTTFTLDYTNSAPEAKSCEVTVEVELASRKTGQLVRVLNSRTYKFGIEPGRSYTVKGSLDGFQDLDVHPRVNCRLTTVR